MRVVGTNLSQLSDRELYAHYKNTAPRADAAFFRALADPAYLTADERTALDALATHVSDRKTHYQRLYAIQSAYRVRHAVVTDAQFAVMARATDRRRSGCAYRAACVRVRTAIERHQPEAAAQVRQLVAHARQLMPWKFAQPEAA
jgi:hypothetical protein